MDVDKGTDKDMNNRKPITKEDSNMTQSNDNGNSIQVYHDSFGSLLVPVGDATVKVGFRMIGCKFHEFSNQPMEVGGLRKLEVLDLVEQLVTEGRLEEEANVFPSKMNPKFKFISLTVNNTTFNIRGYVEGTEFKPSERTKRGDKWFDKSSVAVFRGDLQHQALKAAKKELRTKPIERLLSRKEKAQAAQASQDAPKTTFSG